MIAPVLPMRPSTLRHAHGGVILAVHAIGHTICDPDPDGSSRDHWWLSCDVLWEDTRKVETLQVPAFLLASETRGAGSELHRITEALTEYLCAHGRWDQRDGWIAHRGRSWPAVEQPISLDPAPEQGAGRVPEFRFREVDVQRIEPKPGEVFVLQVDRPISADQAEHLREAWRRLAPDTQVVVLGPEVKLTVATPPAGGAA